MRSAAANPLAGGITDAGPCFSPDGEILFVNVQGGDSAGTGMTCAIWGPWERGPL